QQTFQIYFLERTRAELARVPDANTGARVDAHPVVIFAVRALAKVRKELLGSKKLHEHADIMSSLGTLEPSLEQLLLGDLDDRLYDRAGLTALIGEAVRQRRVGEAFQAILLLELWRAHVGLRHPLVP